MSDIKEIYPLKLPLEFQSGNEIPITRAVITRDQMIEILAQAKAELITYVNNLVDRGPWEPLVEDCGIKVALQSDDFTHDVRIYITGDFYDVTEKLTYAKTLAEQLNNVHKKGGVPHL